MWRRPPPGTQPGRHLHRMEGSEMWVRVVAFRGDVPFLNLSRARSMARAPDDVAAGADARTFVSFGDEDEFQLQATPHELLAKANTRVG